MKKLFTLCAALFITGIAFAQSPNSFNYQAVARDASGKLIKEQSVSIRISILETSAVGTQLFQETHTTTTNKYGMLNLSIGAGTVVSGDFATIDWGSDKHFLKVDMDPNGGSSYTDMGVQQLLSVPYALNAKMAESVKNDAVNDDDADSMNEIQMVSKSGNTVTLNKNGGSFSIEDDDADKTNEIQLISKSGSSITLSQSGGSVTLNDDDAQNELQKISKSGSTVTLDKNGGSFNLNDDDDKNEIQLLGRSGSDVILSKSGGSVSINDADANATNELQKISLANDTISLDQNGGDIAISRINYWRKNSSDLDYTSGNVGVGTSSPKNMLHVQGNRGDTALVYAYNSNNTSPGSSAIKGEAAYNAYGYLGVQSSTDFDNNSLIRFPSSGNEVGVLGVSTGGSASDNVGVMGLTNGGWAGYYKNTGSKNQVSIASSAYGLSIDTGKLGINQRIEHIGDNNTYLDFEDDKATIYAGGIKMIELIEGTNDQINFGTTGVNFGMGSNYSNTKFSVLSGTSENNIKVAYMHNNYNGSSTAVGLHAGAITSGAVNSTTVGAEFFATDGRTGTGTRYAYGTVSSAKVNSTTGSSRAYGIYAATSGSPDIRYAGYFAGNVYISGTYGPSDARLKKNVANLNSSLTKIVSLPVKTYNYKTTELAHMNLPEGNQTGIMAQDLEKVYPELVQDAAQPALSEEQQKEMVANGQSVPAAAKKEVLFKAVNYTGLVPHLVKATQEQQQIIESQKTEIQLLKDKMEAQAKLLLELQTAISNLKK